jgi:hypothetical protein
VPTRQGLSVHLISYSDRCVPSNMIEWRQALLIPEHLQEIEAFTFEDLQKLFSDIWAELGFNMNSDDRLSAERIHYVFATKTDEMLFRMVSAASEDLIS